MAKKTIKTLDGKVHEITKWASKRWYNTRAYGFSNRVVWKDENGDMWVRMRGEWWQVDFRRYGLYGDLTDTTAVERKTYAWVPSVRANDVL